MCFVKVKWIKIQSLMDPLQPLSTKYYKVSAHRCSFFVRLSNQAQNWQAVWGVRRGLQRARGRPLASSPSYHFLAARSCKKDRRTQVAQVQHTAEGKWEPGPSTGVPNIRPGGQNEPSKDSSSAHRMALANVKEGINFNFKIYFKKFYSFFMLKKTVHRR